uniref:Uncharacterized protein n=1 Tax=Anopheles albimanus TaxID=7167 RepID=A0A182FXL6_ANOAL
MPPSNLSSPTIHIHRRSTRTSGERG